MNQYLFLDRRDPTKLGEALLAARETAPKREKIGATYDRCHVALSRVPDYEDGGGILAETVAAYTAEFPDGLPEIDPSGE